MSSGKSKNSRSIRHFKFKKRNLRKNNIYDKFDKLIEGRKREIIKKIRELQTRNIVPGLKISSFKITRDTKRSIFIKANLRIRINKKQKINKAVVLRFIIWTDQKKKPNNWSSANAAGFYLYANQDIQREIVNYISDIYIGIETECLTEIALKELKKENNIFRFRHGTKNEDKKEAKDFIAVFYGRDDVEIEVPIQIKSSQEKLEEHQKRFKEVPGVFREFTGKKRKDVEIIKTKLKSLCREYENNNIIYI